MKNRRFYVVDSKDVSKGFDFVSDGYNSYFSSRKCVRDIFNSYGVPFSKQVIFIEDFLFRLKLSDAREFVTDYNIDISSLKRGKDNFGKTIIYAKSINDFDMIKFNVYKDNVCTYNEVISFFKDLDKLNILENYIYALEEVFRRDYIIDEKIDKIKLLIK